jgi:hypothetical protein
LLNAGIQFAIAGGQLGTGRTQRFFQCCFGVLFGFALSDRRAGLR